MPLISKKTRLTTATTVESDLSPAKESFKLHKRGDTLPAAELVAQKASGTVAEAVSNVEPRKRLCSDIDMRAFKILKSYSIATDKSVISILNNLIYTHCSVKNPLFVNRL